MRSFSEAMSARFKAIREVRNADPRLIEAEELCRKVFIGEDEEGISRSMSGKCYNITIFRYNFPASMDIIFASDEVRMIVRYPNGAAEAVESLKEKLQTLFPEKEVTSCWP